MSSMYLVQCMMNSSQFSILLFRDNFRYLWKVSARGLEIDPLVGNRSEEITSVFERGVFKAKFDARSYTRFDVFS